MVRPVVALLCLLGLAMLPARARAGQDVAQTLAGMSAQGPDCKRTAVLRTHALGVRRLWAAYERHFGRPLAAWARTELPQAPGETVFYPFSGPDLPTAHRMYPMAHRYVLVALEPAGPVPELDDQGLAPTLAAHRQAVDFYVRWGFFRTERLRERLGGSPGATGVTGLLLMLAALEGFQVQAVEPIHVRADGSDVELHPGDRHAESTWSSVRLRLTKAGRPVVLDYLSMDLANDPLRNHVGQVEWVRRTARGRVVLKAASHLLQYPPYRLTRDAIAKGALSVVQDESGLAYERLQPHFDVRLYGAFDRPNRSFDSRLQAALRRAYAERRDVRPLPIRIGYQKTGGSCLQVAVRR